MRRADGVAILVDNLDPSAGLAIGGMERQAALLAEKLASRGRRVIVVTKFFPQAKRSLPLFEKRRGVTIYRVPCWSGFWWTWRTSQQVYETVAAWAIQRHRRELGAIYAVHATGAGLHAARIGPVVGLPTVLKLSGSGKEGELAQARREGEDALALLRSLDRIVHLNDESRDEALAIGVAPDRLVHVPNGIDFTRLDGARAAELPEFSGDREVVTFVGRLGPEKRLDVLLEAFARVRKSRPRARLALAGDGPSRGELEDRARSLGLDGNVAFLGVRKDVASILAASAAFVLPSDREGMSNALLEALAARVPSVASDIPGNKDLIQNEKSGLLVPVGDPAALARALERLLEDRALATRLAAAGRARVEEEFALDRVTDDYLHLFDALPRRERPSLARFAARLVASDLRPLTWLAARGVARNAATVASLALGKIFGRRDTARPRGIAILVHNLDPSGDVATGGMERQAATLAERAAALGREVVVVSTVHPAGASPFSCRFALPFVERRRGVTIYRVPIFRWWDYDTTCLDLYEAVAAWLLGWRHAGAFGAIYAVQAHTAGVHAAKLAPVLGLPVALKLACSGEAGDVMVARRRPDAGRIFDRLKTLDRVVYLNDESRAEALAAGVDAAKLAWIPNGVDLARFPAELAPAELPELPGEVVVFVGRLDAQKRVDLLIDAFAEVARSRPRARLAIVGDGPQRAELEARARAKLEPSRFAFLGVRSDVPAILAAARAFVLCSTDEGISNALLEALAARVPVVASDIAGNRDVVRHEREALLVPPGDQAALARAIERVLEDRALAARLATAGRARVEAEFSIERVVERSLAACDAPTERERPSRLGFVGRYVASDLVGFAPMVARGLFRFARGAARRALFMRPASASSR